MERIKEPQTYPTRMQGYHAPKLVPYAKAAAHGITGHQLASGQAPSIIRGIHAHPTQTALCIEPEWADAEWEELAQRVRAVTTILPTAVAGGPTAAKLLGLPLPTNLDFSTVYVTLPAKASRTRLSGVRSRSSRFYARWETFRLPVNHPLFIVMELARYIAGDDLVVAIDALVGHWHGEPVVGLEALRRGLSQHAGYRHRGALLQAAARAREHTRSPKETEWRLRIVAAGLPEPIPNWVIQTGTRKYRELDLAFVDYKVAGEYQGYHDHMRLADQVARDGTRSVDVQLAGWIEVPITRELAPEIYLQQLREALESRGWRQ